MNFNNYCIVVMGNTENIIPEIERISEKLLGSLNAKGIVITTFLSNLTIPDLNDYFKSFNRNFLLFLVNDETSGFNFLKKDIETELFSKLLKNNELTNLTNTLTKPFNEIKSDNQQLDVQSLTKKEKEEKIHQLIEKGYENLTDYDLDILNKLSKS